MVEDSPSGDAYTDTVRDTEFDENCHSGAMVIMTSGESNSVYRPTTFTLCSNSNSSLIEVEEAQEEDSLASRQEEDSLASRSEAFKITPDLHESEDRGVILIEATSDDEILSP